MVAESERAPLTTKTEGKSDIAKGFDFVVVVPFTPNAHERERERAT